MEYGQRVFRVGVALIVPELLGLGYMLMSLPAQPSLGLEGLLIATGILSAACIFYGLDKYMTGGIGAFKTIRLETHARLEGPRVSGPEEDQREGGRAPAWFSEEALEALERAKNRR